MNKTIVVSLLVFIGILIILLTIYSSSDNSLLKNICKGSAKCFEGVVEDVIDGDTLEINGETVRLTLVDTPEKWEKDYESSIDFVWELCPIGRRVIVDEDDLQTSGSHRRTVAVVYYESNGQFKNLNEELLSAGYAEILKDFCERSEFSKEKWAILYGCG